MKNYASIAGEGFSLVAIPILAAFVVALYAAAFPFFLLGLLKRGAVAAITGGDPLVP